MNIDGPTFIPNAGETTKALHAYQRALSKLVNRLSDCRSCIIISGLPSISSRGVSLKVGRVSTQGCFLKGVVEHSRRNFRDGKKYKEDNLTTDSY